MSKETVTKGMKGEQAEDGYKRATGSLPPLLILNVGEKVKGEIIDVDVTEQRSGKKKSQTQTRIFYRLALEEKAQGMDGKTEEVKTYGQGEIVTVPGTGALDSIMGGIARELEATGEDDEPNYKALKGVRVIIKRTPDDKMRKGPFAGKMVKTYDVQWKK